MKDPDRSSCKGGGESCPLEIYEELDRLLSTVLETRRWKTGNALGELSRRWRAKPLDPAPEVLQERIRGRLRDRLAALPPFSVDRPLDANTATREEALAAVRSLEGKIHDSECALLYDLAARASSGVIVEIGSYRGQSTAALALGTRAGANLPVYAIEPHEEFRGANGGRFGPADRAAFFRTMLALGTAESVRLVNLSSSVLARGWTLPVGLLWIDGDHRLEAVESDIACWLPHLVPGGEVAFHDSKRPELGPVHVIAQLVESGEFDISERVHITTVLRRRLDGARAEPPPHADEDG